MYKLEDIFYLDKEYAQRAEFCSQNNLAIIEIEADELGRRFQIVEPPKPTQTELLQMEIEELKIKLSETDYKAIKFSEGVITLAEYEPTREQRKKWREKINILENSLKNV